MKKCKVLSVKPLGKQKTYNVTMAGDQHNYRITGSSGTGVYSRNSHACAYAYLAYQEAWLKTYYRPEFMAGLLSYSCSPQDDDKRARYEKNANSHGIRILPFDINKSGSVYVIEELNGKLCLRRPLTAMKGVGGAAVKKIAAGQPFSDMTDFVRKTSGHINSAVLSFLADSGCMKVWDSDPEKLKEQFDSIRKRVKKEEKTKKSLSQYDGGFIDM